MCVNIWLRLNWETRTKEILRPFIMWNYAILALEALRFFRSLKIYCFGMKCKQWDILLGKVKIPRNFTEPFSKQSNLIASERFVIVQGVSNEKSMNILGDVPWLLKHPKFKAIKSRSCQLLECSPIFCRIGSSYDTLHAYTFSSKE